MRVITGSARGRNLETLKGDDIVRPTSQKIKEVMFSAIQFSVAGARVLDLCAGSGQLGIEALSRDASMCVFVDRDRAACDIVKHNLKKTGLFQKSRVTTGDAGRFLAFTKDKFDLIFIDPPYKQGVVNHLLPLVVPVVSAGGYVLCETESDCSLPQTMGSLELKREYRHGSTTVWLYRNNIEPEI